MKLSKTDFLFCIQACINAYKGKHGEVKEIFDSCEYFEKDFPFLKYNDFKVEGIIGLKDKKLYIVFQGTHGIIDWIYDFKFWQRTIPYNNSNSNIRVHDGFIDQYKCIRPLIHEKVSNYIKSQNKKSKIIITGHSLGAALATLCAVDIQYNFSDKGIDISCPTYGSPRVGNKAFADSFNRRILDSYRIVNGSDIVTKVPKVMTLIYFYYHVNALIHVGKEPKWYNLLDNIIGNKDDHYPEKYLINIDKATIP